MLVLFDIAVVLWPLDWSSATKPDFHELEKGDGEVKEKRFHSCPVLKVSILSSRDVTLLLHAHSRLKWSFARIPHRQL